MPSDRDLEIAHGQFAQLGLPKTASTIDAMLRGGELDWSHLDAFLRELEAESEAVRPPVKQTFRSLEQVLMTALGGQEGARRSDIVRLARTAPSLDEPAQRMARVFPPIHASLERLGRGTDVESLLLAALLGHVVRMQILTDVVHAWVGHWGQGLDEEHRRAAIHYLLMLEFAVGPENQRVPDTSAYRHAVAHGHFQVKGHQVRFWHHDRRGVLVTELPALTSGDILNLYNLGELRLRGIEAFTRALVGWARHTSEAPSETAH